MMGAVVVLLLTNYGPSTVWCSDAAGNQVELPPQQPNAPAKTVRFEAVTEPHCWTLEGTAQVAVEKERWK